MSNLASMDQKRKELRFNSQTYLMDNEQRGDTAKAFPAVSDYTCTKKKEPES